MYALDGPVTRVSLREEQRRLTRRRIADAARRCFYERGVGATSMDEVARVAGVGRATLYLHFANRDALLLELLAMNLRGVRVIFDALDDADPAAVRTWLERYVATMQAHREAMRLFHVGLANNPAARTLIDDHRDRLADRLAKHFDPAGRCGRARLLLMLARIDHLASAAAEEEPRFPINDGLALVAAEMTEILSSRPK